MALLLLGSVSCKKDKPETIVSTPMLTMTFAEKFIPDQIPVIVFLSEPDGKIILDTTCILNGTYVLYPPAGKVIPDKFMVTVVSSELYWHNLIAHINTYSSVDKGSTWTLLGTKPDTLTSSYVSLQQMPAHIGPILYAGFGYSNLTFNSENRTIWNYQVPDDLYVKIRTADGQFYKYEKDLMTGGAYSIDMSTASPTESTAVLFPMQVENYEAKLYAYPNENYASPIPMLTDYLISDGIATNSIELNYPPSLFSGFHTNIMIQETYLSELSWYFQTEGAIPNQLVKVNADIVAMESQTGKLTLQTNGSFDMVGAHWQFIDHALLFYEWQVYAPNTTQTIILPEIPSAFTRMFPTISLDSIHFQYTELTDFQNLTSYDALMNALFDPAHPTQMNRYDAASVRKTMPVPQKK